MTEFVDLSTTELAKLINDEYDAILATERTNLPRAQKVGEKLKVLRDKAKHGEWKTKLAEHCPKLSKSYETATLYIRLWDGRDKLPELAKAKGVTVTDLTIQEARKLLATPKSDDKGKPSKAVKGGVQEPGMEPKPGTLPPDEQVKRLELDYGDMFETLKRKYDQDDLMRLTKLLAANLGMALVPLRPSIPPVGPIVSAPASTPTGVERRL